MAEKRERRNAHGVKDSADQYRTIGGAHHVCWLSDATPDRVAAYRSAGVRCARRGDDLYVHHMDLDAAAKVDRGAQTAGERHD